MPMSNAVNNLKVNDVIRYCREPRDGKPRRERFSVFGGTVVKLNVKSVLIDEDDTGLVRRLTRAKLNKDLVLVNGCYAHNGQPYKAN